MVTGFLSDETRIVVASNLTAGAAGTTPITSAAIDMQGYDACIVFIGFGVIDPGAVVSITVQQSADDGATDDYSTVRTPITIRDTDDNKLKYVDIQRPGKRFLKIVVNRGNAPATVGAIIPMLYQRGRTPSAGGLAHGPNVAGVQWLSPTEPPVVEIESASAGSSGGGSGAGTEPLDAGEIGADDEPLDEGDQKNARAGKTRAHKSR